MQITSSIFKTSEFPALANFSGYWGTIREEALKLDDFAFNFSPTNRLILYIEFYKNHIGFNEDFLELD